MPSRERYIKNRESAAFDDLGDRVRQLSKRTLRRDADKYIRFTERLPLTVGFEPSADEQRLYELVNEYLQRDELYAFSTSTRHLSALILRKRLGSSTYAIAEHSGARGGPVGARDRRRASLGGPGWVRCR